MPATIKAARDAIDTIPVWGFVQCSPRRYDAAKGDDPRDPLFGFGLNRSPIGDHRRLLADDQPVGGFLRFGITNMVMHLPFGKPVLPHDAVVPDPPPASAGDMPFGALLMHDAETRDRITGSYQALVSEVRARGGECLTYVGALRSVPPRVRTPVWQPWVNVDGLFRYAVECLMPAIVAGRPQICLDAASHDMPHAALNEIVVRLREMLAKMGGQLWVEPPPHNTARFVQGLPSVTREALFSSNTAPWIGKSSRIIRSVHGGGTMRRSGVDYHTHAHEVLADCARRLVETGQRTELAVGYTIDRRYPGGIEELRDRARACLSDLPRPYWQRESNRVGFSAEEWGE